LKFNKNYNIFIGINGSGKTSILDAISISLGGFTSGIDGIGNYGFSKDDVQYKMYQTGGTLISREKQYPVSIESTINFENTVIEAKRSLLSESGRTTTKEAKDLISYASNLQNKIRKGDNSIELPLIAYYGTGRLWNKKNKTDMSINSNHSRLNGYTLCLSANTNEKMFLEWIKKMTLVQLQNSKVIPELEAVKNALSKCYKTIDDTIEEAIFDYDLKSDEIEVTITRNNKIIEKLPIRLLSDGIKSIFSIISNISFRMATLNPQFPSEKICNTSGIVIIDEVDMHLHPSWQKKIINDLIDIFPNIQFFFSTHSPIIIGNVENNDNQFFVLNNNKIDILKEKSYGRNNESILENIMDVNSKPKKIVDLWKKFNDSIDNENIKEAKQILEKLKYILGDNDKEYIIAETTLFLETLGDDE